MGIGFRTATSGGVAAPPYTNGPYTFSEDITFEGAVTISGTMIFGDAAVDTLTIGGTATISSNNKFYFRDSGLYLWSSADGQFDAVADTVLKVTAPTVELEASTAITLDGDVALDGAHTFGTGTGAVSLNGDVTVAAGKVLYIRDASQSIASASDDLMTLTSPTLTFAGSTKINLDGPVYVSGALVLDTGATTLLTISADGTTGISITSGFSGTTGISFAGTATDGIAISGACTTGISLSGAATTGIGISYVGATASAKALSTVGFTLNNGNLTDGYGAIEGDLTLTGTVVGAVSALSSWVNMATVTTGSNYVCAQTNGLWSDSGCVGTNGVFIFGMRAQCLMQTNGGVVGAKFYPFSVVNNTNITTAIFRCNAGSSDLGTTAVIKTTEAKYVPLYEDDAGVHYVLIYN